jgi:hypothetical protein
MHQTALCVDRRHAETPCLKIVDGPHEGTGIESLNIGKILGNHRKNLGGERVLSQELATSSKLNRCTKSPKLLSSVEGPRD